jgi:peptidoglycan-associated lipoprotein
MADLTVEPAGRFWRTRRVCMVLALLLAASVPCPAVAQSTNPVQAVPAGGGLTVNSVGLCQCVGERNALKMHCAASTAACAVTCGGSIYSLLPLAQDALSECRPSELYVVLPNADGRPGSGAIEVGSGTSSITLDQAYGAAAALPGGGAGSVAVPPAVTQNIFATAIAARPILPRTFVLYFASGSVQLDPQGAAEYRKAIADIKSRPAFEIELIGNTDTVAGDALNAKLSFDRAVAIGEALVRDGIDRRVIEVTARGKSNLAVRTGDNVPEERNRRVELVVR